MIVPAVRNMGVIQFLFFVFVHHLSEVLGCSRDPPYNSPDWYPGQTGPGLMFEPQIIWIWPIWCPRKSWLHAARVCAIWGMDWFFWRLPTLLFFPQLCSFLFNHGGSAAHTSTTIVMQSFSLIMYTGVNCHASSHAAGSLLICLIFNLSV